MEKGGARHGPARDWKGEGDMWKPFLISVLLATGGAGACDELTDCNGNGPTEPTDIYVPPDDPEPPRINTAGWTLAKCGDPAQVWRGSPPGAQLMTTCQSACSYVATQGINSNAADEYCNRLIPSYDNLKAPGSDPRPYRDLCVPCDQVPK